MDETSAKTIARREGWLAGEDAWVQDAVLARVRLRRFAPGEFVYRAEEDPGGIYGMVDGGIGALITSGAGDIVLCHVVRRGTWFGHGPVLTGKPRTMTFQAVEESIAFQLPLSSVTEICATYPDFRLRLAALSERNYSTVALKVIGDLMMPSTERRIAAVLLRISKSDLTAEKPQYWPILLTQAEIGQMANASRDRVSRAIARFEAAGWIKSGYKQIEVTNPAALTSHIMGKHKD